MDEQAVEAEGMLRSVRVGKCSRGSRSCLLLGGRLVAVLVLMVNAVGVSDGAAISDPFV